jgi:diguanylate cyclase (GGDEF)-like protein
LAKISFTDDGVAYRVTLSIGIAQYRMSDKDELEIIQRADQALYAAKQNGRNRIQVFAGKSVITVAG